MRLRIPLLLCAATVVLSLSAAGASHREVPLRVEPPQAIGAIVIRSGQEVRSVEVRNGKAIVPPEIALPWTLGLTRFEPAVYTQSDLAQGKAFLVRELGLLRGTLRRSAPTKGERFTWLLQRSDLESAQEIQFTPGDDGSFQVPLAAGIYQGAVFGSTSGSRIRSGMIIKPGAPTDIGPVACEPTVPVSIRVLDAKRGGAIAGARITWNPPGEKLNADLNRILFASKWSTVTDRYGTATVPSVGPLPLSVRWNVQAPGYAPAQTMQLQLTEPKRFAMPDTRLKPEAAVVVRVQLPGEEEKAFRDAVLALGEVDDPRMRRFTRKARAELRDGDTKFAVSSYGPKRVWIETAAGKRVLYHDFVVNTETTIVDLAPHAIELRGRVTRKNEPVEGVIVTLADPNDGSVILAQARSEADGDYALTTFQSGKLFLYTISGGGAGKTSGSAEQTVDATDKHELRVDFALPDAGFIITVLDAHTGAPIRARVLRRLRFAGDRMISGRSETDEKGRLVVSGYSEGTAKLAVQAKGYRTKELELPIRPAMAETIVRLEPSRAVTGRVLDAHGVPIAGARVMGGFESELDMQGFFSTATDAAGRFQFDSAPDLGTTFYVAAAGHALAIATLDPNVENTIRLTRPTSGMVTLRPDNAPPTKVYMAMAAPTGDTFIPLGVLDDLAEVNGMNPYQLHGTALDGSLVLPEFLGPGNYHLYIALRGGKPFVYEKVGTITTPLSGNVTFAYKAK